MVLNDMVFQGTVWGCILWNTFFKDATTPINEANFEEIIYADDLNAWKTYAENCDDAGMTVDMDTCQRSLHEWGHANSLEFDAAKESQHILKFRSNCASSFVSLA